ncbi:unnamed protein product, partial [Mesorhabditis spiculigera]
MTPQNLVVIFFLLFPVCAMGLLNFHFHLANTEEARNLSRVVEKSLTGFLEKQKAQFELTNETARDAFSDIYHCHLMRRAQTRAPSMLVHIPAGARGDAQLCNPTIYGSMRLVAQLHGNLKDGSWQIEVQSPCGRIFYQAPISDVVELLYYSVLLDDNCKQSTYNVNSLKTIGRAKMDVDHRKAIVLAHYDSRVFSFLNSMWLLPFSVYIVLELCSLNWDLVRKYRYAGFKRIHWDPQLLQTITGSDRLLEAGPTSYYSVPMGHRTLGTDDTTRSVAQHDDDHHSTTTTSQGNPHTHSHSSE